MKVVILAGGFGTRLSEETSVRPKPMVEIGGRPILWHIMKHYAAYGHNEFVLALGYKAEIIKQYFLQYPYLLGDITVDLKGGDISIRKKPTEDWVVHLIETGLNTQTGGRVRRLRDILSDASFMLTYGDGVANVDLNAVEALHRARGRLATVTAVRPPSRFGGIDLDEDLVTGFTEKPQIGEGWINGGFMVLEPSVIDLVEGDSASLEIHVLEKLAERNQLTAYRHTEFWQCMDTMRDKLLLDRLWESGAPPWKSWNDDG